ncbi:hypothetical protein F4556_000326 [Kitasatospora gansuensis]|uniref:Uncharacterized protein n=2 Tax=Kitasatospora TaxID=2063 RepID=A0A7W7WF22_9ACTN|nr:hypothetical protein [Kitasatospora gansuensis]MBB4944791.1 hypothetical protein [Kitasatospora gansuensis]
MTEIDAMAAEIAKSAGWQRFQSCDDFVNAWISFVDQCASGYDMSIYEYENDLAVRTAIQILLVDGRMRRLEGFEEFELRVQRTDEYFKGLLQDGIETRDQKDFWWQRGVPKFAGAELADDFMNLFGVSVRAVD